MPGPPLRPQPAFGSRRAEIRNLLAQAERALAAGDFAGTVKRCQEVVARQPDHPVALQLLGTMAQQTGANDVAIGFFTRALASDKRLAAAHLGLGDAYAVAKRGDEAIAAYRAAIALEPRNTDAMCNLGALFLSLNRREDAIESFRRAHAVAPGHKLAAYMLAELTGKETGQQADYVRATFDHYAEMFDEHLVKTLHYRMPELIAQTLAVLHPEPFAAALDLGCGTGLVADALSSGRVGVIDGVDVSPKMLDAARQKGKYRTLQVADLRDFLADPALKSAGYDLVIAADVFIYVGALETIFPLVRALLPPGGLFVFSVEQTEANGYLLQPSSRHAHSESYIAGLAKTAGFLREAPRLVPLREENKVAIPGRLEVLRVG